MTTLKELLVVLAAISHGCLSQPLTNSSDDSTTTLPLGVTTQQMGSSENVSVTASPRPRLCNPLKSELTSICQLTGRNSEYAYPQSLPGGDVLDISSVEILIFAIQTLDPQPPKECVEGSIYILCLLIAPPCDPLSDDRLPICERSCEAMTRLRSDGTCTVLDQFISNLAQSSAQNRFLSLRNLYFAIDCRNSSTFDFYNGELNFTQNGECTDILSPSDEDLILSRPPICKAVPTGHCSQSTQTGYYFETSLTTHNEDTVMGLLNNAQNSINDDEFCRNDELLTDLVCLFVYPPCVPQNRTQLGICTESCTTLSTFVTECIPNDGLHDVAENVSIASIFFSTLMNLTCSDTSQSYLIPGAEVSKTQCTQLGNTVNARIQTDIKVVVIVVCLMVVLAAVTIGVSLMVIFICRRKRKYTMSADMNYPSTNSKKNPYDGLELAERDCETAECCEMPDDVTLSGTDIEDYRNLFASVLVLYNTLIVGKVIGQGAFGKVFKGQLSTKDSKDVAIKTIKNMTSQEQLKAFFSESLIMKDFDHPNVLGLTGVCFDTPDGYPFLILPFMVNGSLKEYLKKSRRHVTDVNTFPKGLPLSRLVQMCLDIVNGMKYLADKKFVHRDLAARNCMVDDNLRIKVGDFGLAKDLYSSDYYRANRNAKLPVKWMPPETLHDSISNEKTDVWSYGVTCWEVFSLGRTPYPGIDNHDILNFISSGGRLDKPTLCPQEIYSIIILCWELKPEDRPNFIDISDQMEDYWEREHLYI